MPALSSNNFPSSFRVHESSSSAPSTSRQTLDQTTFTSLQSTITSRALSSLSSLRQKLDQIELLSSPGCTLTDLRRAGAILDTSAWGDLLEERHMEGMCPYPTCQNPPSTTYDPTASEEAVKFKLRGNALLESSAGEEDSKGAFCSQRCRARAEWYKINCVGTGRTELLEDVEERRRQVARSAKEVREVAELKQVETSREERLRPDDSERTTRLLETLTIKERTTHDETPSVPTFDAPDFEGSGSGGRSQMTLKPTRNTPLPTSTSSLPSLRPLVSPPSKSLAQAPPPIRVPGQTDEEAPMPVFTSPPTMLDHEGREVEWDVELGDEEGEGEEEREAWGWLEKARREAEKEEM